MWSELFVFTTDMKLHLAALYNHNILVRLVPCRSGILNHANNVHAVDNLPEHHMLAVQERRRDGRDEELATVRIGSRVLRQPSAHPVVSYAGTNRGGHTAILNSPGRSCGTLKFSSANF